MKYHLNIQSIKKITAFQNEEVYSSWNQVFWFLWCSDQHCWIFCRKYYLHVFSPFSVLLSNLSITECIFNIIVTSFKSRQFLYQLHIWYCMFPSSPPPSGINFCILWYKLILPCLSTLTERLLSIQILKKVDAVCRKTNFTCFRCRTDAGWVIDKYRLTAISSKYMLRY